MPSSFLIASCLFGFATTVVLAALPQSGLLDVGGWQALTVAALMLAGMSIGLFGFGVLRSMTKRKPQEEPPNPESLSDKGADHG